jgi:hypothetical protein
VPKVLREIERVVIVALGVLGAVGLLALLLAIATRREASTPLIRLVWERRDAGVDAAVTDAAVTDAAVTDAAVTDAAVTDAAVDDASMDDAYVSYALDDFPRRPELVAEGCPEVPLVDHLGTPVPWEPPLRVHPSFVPAVSALEEAIAETAREVYGREVAHLFCASSYRCTTVRRRPERISEHALGNAIDLRGIALTDGTETSVAEHWHAGTADDAIHARFWRTLVERVHARGIFRGILGPPAPDHTDHLHFDRGPSTFFDLVLNDSEGSDRAIVAP